jgi:FtsH-binding integral membrane protein
MLCGIHCLILPIALSFFSIASFRSSDLRSEEWVHRVFAAVAILIAAIGLRSGYRRHRNRAALVLGAAGSILLILASIFSSFLSSEVSEVVITLSGATVLSAAHLWNWSLLKASCRCSGK